MAASIFAACAALFATLVFGAQLFGPVAPEAPAAALAFIAALPFVLAAAFVRVLQPGDLLRTLALEFALQLSLAALALGSRRAGLQQTVDFGIGFFGMQSLVWLFAAAGLWMRNRSARYEVRRGDGARNETEGLFDLIQQRRPDWGLSYVGYRDLLAQGAVLIGGAGAEPLFAIHLWLRPDAKYLHTILEGRESRADFSFADFISLCVARPELRVDQRALIFLCTDAEFQAYGPSLASAGFRALSEGGEGAETIAEIRVDLDSLRLRRQSEARPFDAVRYYLKGD